jgi:hypothetical protein
MPRLPHLLLLPAWALSWLILTASVPFHRPRPQPR